MIIASIYRTDPKQIEEKGAIAWRPMTFNAAAASVAQVKEYCRRLAEGDGIIDPRIVIETK